MAITYDPQKRERALAERKLDLLDAVEVFAGTTIDIPDIRKDYGEVRIVSYGFLRGRLVVVGWTARGEDRHVFSMRKANGREQAAYRERFGQG